MGYHTFVKRFRTAFTDMNSYIRSRERERDSSSIDAELFSNLLQNGPVPSNNRVYLINGWRWHTISVLRDIRRFKRIIDDMQRSNQHADQTETLVKCHSFLCTFNWKALLRIESEIFFPWLAENIPSAISKKLLGKLYSKHAEIRALSISLEDLCIKSKTSNNLADISNCLDNMSSCASSIQTIQNEIFVPFVSAYVTASEQDRFNNKVIAKLGLIESQVHLVSMFEALVELPDEMKSFEKQIPRIAQALIPVWRKQLYNPRAKYLDM